MTDDPRCQGHLPSLLATGMARVQVPLIPSISFSPFFVESSSSPSQHVRKQSGAQGLVLGLLLFHIFSLGDPVYEPNYVLLIPDFFFQLEFQTYIQVLFTCPADIAESIQFLILVSPYLVTPSQAK